MSEMERSAHRARRRLLLNRWLACLGWSLAGAAVLFVVIVGVQRSFGLIENTTRLYNWAGLGLLGGVAAISLLWAYVGRESLRAAAAHLDKAAGLKERISSGLYCAGVDDPFAKAVVLDAERVSRGISIKHHLPVRIPDSAAWAGGSVVLAFLFFLLFPTLDLTGKQEARATQQEKKSAVAKAEAVLKPMLAPDIKKLAEENPNLKKELQELESPSDGRLETPADVRQEMMKKVERISDKLEQQAKNGDTAKIDEFKQMMRKLANEPKSDTPVGDLSKALAKGDLNSAQESIAKLQEQLAKEPKTDTDKKKAQEMQGELKNLSDKLNQIAADQKKLNDQMAKAGMSQQEAKQAMEKLAKGDTEGLKKQLEQKGMSKQQAEQMAQQMKKQCDAGSLASKLAQNMAKAAQGQTGQNGQPMDASDMQGLADAAQQLSNMEQMEQDMNQLKSSMAQLNNMKNKIGQSCSQCNGSGKDGSGNPCPACGGSGALNGQGKGGGDPNNMGGGEGNLGRGEGGLRSMEETKYNTVNKQAKVYTDKGAIISTQFIKGEQYKGEVSKEFQEAEISAQREAADNIAQEKIPRQYQKSVSEYFRRTEGGAAQSRPAK